MKKTRELELFESLTVDPNEVSNTVKVVFLNKKLLDMADNYKKKHPTDTSGDQENAVVDLDNGFQVTP